MRIRKWHSHDAQENCGIFLVFPVVGVAASCESFFFFAVIANLRNETSIARSISVELRMFLLLSVLSSCVSFEGVEETSSDEVSESFVFFLLSARE